MIEWDQIPLLLDVRQLAEVMGLGKAAAYGLCLTGEAFWLSV